MTDTTLSTPDGPMGLTISEPTGTARGAVIVVQEAFGVTAHIADVTRRAAAAGWYAVAPHLFHRSGDPDLAYDDIPAVTPHLQALTAQGLGADLDATLEDLAAAGDPAAHVGIVGFCMGGAVSFWAGTRTALAASVSFYGGGVREGRFGLPSLIELAPGLQTPWLGLYGDLDKSIPVTDVEELRSAASTATVATELVRYTDAEHGFHCDDRPAVFNPTAAADAWSRTVAHFAAHLPG